MLAGWTWSAGSVRPAELAAALDAVASGERRLVVLRGEAGIGKTRLLQVVLEQATSRRFEVLTGRATELESDIPLAVFREALPDLVPVSPEDPEARWQLFRGVAESLTGPRPRALVLDDAHWADPLSRELLESLVRRPPRGPHLLVVGGCAPGAVADAVLAAARVGWPVTHPARPHAARPGRGRRCWIGPDRSAERPSPDLRRARGQPAAPRGAGARRTPATRADGIVAAVSAELADLGTTRSPWSGPARCWAIRSTSTSPRVTAGLDLPVGLGRGRRAPRPWTGAPSGVRRSSPSGTRSIRTAVYESQPVVERLRAMRGPPRRSESRRARCRAGPAPRTRRRTR